MYVIRYMKLMRRRTSQRVFVGLDATFSWMAALGDADVGVVSSMMFLGGLRRSGLQPGRKDSLVAGLQPLKL
jgi:hypothetical protein